MIHAVEAAYLRSMMLASSHVQSSQLHRMQQQTVKRRPFWLQGAALPQRMCTAAAAAAVACCSNTRSTKAQLQCGMLHWLISLHHCGAQVVHMPGQHFAILPVLLLLLLQQLHMKRAMRCHCCMMAALPALHTTQDRETGAR